ncbi:MAG: beta-propeller fold lactonase family protein [Solirubrobacteraceae bacterium]
MASLRVRSGPLSGTSIEVKGDLVIGREGVDVVIEDPELSRRHVVVRRVASGLEVEDLGSSNGTFVDGVRIEAPTVVGGGAELKIGTTLLVVEGVLGPQPTRHRAVVDPQKTKIADPQATVARSVPADLEATVTRSIPADFEATVARSVPADLQAPPAGSAPADLQVTAARSMPSDVAPAEPERRFAAPAPRAPTTEGSSSSTPIGTFSPPGRKRTRGLASRSWVPVVLSFGTVLLTAIALVIYFASRSTSGAAAKTVATNLDLDAVYTETNNVQANAIVVFTRHANGTLTFRQRVLTGGKGANDQPPFGFQVVDSSESIRLSNDGRMLFAVNSGDNSVSSFVVSGSGLHLVSHSASGGNFPVSLALSGNLLYVLNEKSGTIAGLRVSSSGDLTPIAGSSRSLSTPGVAAAAAQIGFAPGGEVLNVTERLKNIIDTFRLRSNGTPGQAVATVTPTGANNPFGFTYQGTSHLIVTNADAADKPMFSHSSASSYALGQTLTDPLTPISGRVLAGGAATCWVVLTNNQRYLFMSNTGSGGTPDGISRFAVSPGGALSLIGHAPATAGFTSDLALSIDGSYLYVLLPSNVVDPFTPMQAPAPATSHIDEYKVGPGGSLTVIGSTPSNLPDGLSGIAAW